MTAVNSVLGAIAPDELGITLMHEHILYGYPGWEGDQSIAPLDRGLIVNNAVATLTRLKTIPASNPMSMPRPWTAAACLNSTRRFPKNPVFKSYAPPGTTTKEKERRRTGRSAAAWATSGRNARSCSCGK